MTTLPHDTFVWYVDGLRWRRVVALDRGLFGGLSAIVYDNPLSLSELVEYKLSNAILLRKG